MPTEKTTDPGAIRTFDEDALWTLVEHLDVPDVLDGAIRDAARVADNGDPGTHNGHSAVEYVELPAGALTALRSAGCAAAAARRLTSSCVLTVGVVGAVAEVWWHVAVLCRSLPAVTHIAVTTDVAAVPGRIADQLDFLGVGLTAVRTARDAAFGANLVFAAAPAALTVEHLSGGALLVEASPGMFPLLLRSRAQHVLPADASGPVRTDRGFSLVLPPARTSKLDAALVGELLAVDSYLDLLGRG